jgi:hypothetical protein
MFDAVAVIIVAVIPLFDTVHDVPLLMVLKTPSPVSIAAYSVEGVPG